MINSYAFFIIVLCLSVILVDYMNYPINLNTVGLSLLVSLVLTWLYSSMTEGFDEFVKADLKIDDTKPMCENNTNILTKLDSVDNKLNERKTNDVQTQINNSLDKRFVNDLVINTEINKSSFCDN